MLPRHFSSFLHVFPVVLHAFSRCLSRFLMFCPCSVLSIPQTRLNPRRTAKKAVFAEARPGTRCGPRAPRSPQCLGRWRGDRSTRIERVVSLAVRRALYLVQCGPQHRGSLHLVGNHQWTQMIQLFIHGGVGAPPKVA